MLGHPRRARWPSAAAKGQPTRAGGSAVRNPGTRQGVAAIAALVGGDLLYLSGTPDSDFTTALLSFWAGVILLGIIAWVLSRFYAPGSETPSADEIGIKGWQVVRFLRYG